MSYSGFIIYVIGICLFAGVGFSFYFYYIDVIRHRNDNNYYPPKVKISHKNKAIRK